MRLPAEFAGCTATPVRGGDINEAAHIDRPDGTVAFLKWNARAPRDMFGAEARGLDALAEALGTGVPTVLGVGEGHLLLEWVDPGRPRPGSERQLATALARLHAVHAPRFGLDHPNFIGTLAQPNDWCDTWASFHATQRIAPQLRMARDAGMLDVSQVAAIERGTVALHAAMPDEPPTLVHGDLWAGNVLYDAEGSPWLVDPAIAFAHREAELAFMRLFGGFGDELWHYYHELCPIADGFDRRCHALQVYPLLVHANLFGVGYAARAVEAARSML